MHTIMSNRNKIIDRIEWGNITVKADSFSFKDVIIHNDSVEEWDWKKTGTKHDPGIQIADLIQIIDKIDHIVLSTGFKNQLRVQDNTLNYIKFKKKNYYVLNTEEAVKKYNQLARAGHRVGALIHSTC